MKMGISGIDKMKMETEKFDVIVKGTYTICAEEVYGKSETPGLSVYGYGSPGRGEIVGGDSDADVFLVEQRNCPQTIAFRRRFDDILSKFDYSKIDLPEWGTLDDLETYLDISLVEGNQVLETRFLAGDTNVDSNVQELKSRYNSPERTIKNIVFNRFYFGQYFKQRVRNGYPNIKYCRGGSREFMLLNWYSELMSMTEGTQLKGCPKIFRALQYLKEKKKITKKEFREAVDALNFLTVLRGDILELNRRTEERGITILDPETGERLLSRGYPSFEDTYNKFKYYSNLIGDIVDRAYDDTIKQASRLKDKKWERDFRLAHKNIQQEDRLSISSEDDIIRIALLWGAHNHDQETTFNEIARRHIDTHDWATIGSIVCSPLSDPKYLGHFGTGVLKNKGYGYLLRVVARNPNTPKEVLKDIAKDTKLEKRYREIAQAGLIGGNGSANNQI